MVSASCSRGVITVEWRGSSGLADKQPQVFRRCSAGTKVILTPPLLSCCREAAIQTHYPTNSDRLPASRPAFVQPPAISFNECRQLHADRLPALKTGSRWSTGISGLGNRPGLPSSLSGLSHSRRSPDPQQHAALVNNTLRLACLFNSFAYSVR